jgi:hypothetical protein
MRCNIRIVALAGSTATRIEDLRGVRALCEVYVPLLDTHWVEARTDNVVVGWDVRPVCDANRVGEEAV